MDMNENLRAAVIRRIKALLTKTIENGATEAEAMFAAAKAKEMMTAYQVTQTEAELEADGTMQHQSSRKRSGKIFITDWIARAVGAYCDCRPWHTNGQHVMFGLTGDAEFASWLLASLRTFIENESNRYIASRRYASGSRLRWEERKSFMVGCARRISERLDALTRERHAAHATTSDGRAAHATMSDGRSLVVVKGQIVERAFKATGIRLRTASRGRIGLNRDGAYDAGRAAGDGASFGRPLNGGGATRMIGR